LLVGIFILCTPDDSLAQAEDTYFQANNWASYDDWRRARDQWDYFCKLFLLLPPVHHCSDDGRGLVPLLFELFLYCFFLHLLFVVVCMRGDPLASAAVLLFHEMHAHFSSAPCVDLALCIRLCAHFCALQKRSW
jgi:hypothetical protein